MRLTRKMRCVVCRCRPPILPEGRRVIDGTRVADQLIPKRWHGKWVCSKDCYRKLLPQWYLENKHSVLP
jgi:hypothetical protein